MKKLFIALLAGILSLAFVGCNSNTTITETPVIGTDGKPVLMPDGKTLVVTKVEAKTSESPLAHKTFSTGGAVTAIDVETSMSSSSESTTPHVIIGGSAFALSSSANDEHGNKPTMCYSESCGWLKAITSMTATSSSFTYTGLEGETAEQTSARINAIVKAKQGIVSGVDPASVPATSTTQVTK